MRASLSPIPPLGHRAVDTRPTSTERGQRLTPINTASSAAAARRYYDTADVDGFYTAVWGGESIHMGIYTDEHEEIATASHRTTERMADRVITHLGPGRTVLDLGSGYGGPAGYLMSRFGCRVVALNISHVQNRRHRDTAIACGAGELITVITGSFDDIPCASGQVDVVWSQDALSHAAAPFRALTEAVRVLTPNGQLIFTDLMAADDTPAEALRPIVARTAAETLPTPSFYRKNLAALGFAHVEFDDLSEHLLTHYRRINEQTRLRRPELVNSADPPAFAGRAPVTNRHAGNNIDQLLRPRKCHTFQTDF